MEVSQRALTLALMLGLAGCGGRLVVEKLPAPATPKLDLPGVLYALPKTVVQVDLPVELTMLKKGKFGDYVLLFFPKEFEAKPKNYVETDGKEIAVKRAAFSTFGEPDLSQIYLVKATGRGPIDRSGMVEWTERGSVTGTKLALDDQTVDIAMSILNTATGVAKSAALGASDTKGERDTCKSDEPYKIFACKLAALDRVYEEEVLKAWENTAYRGAVTQTLKDGVDTSKKQLTGGLQKAYEAFGRLNGLRARRTTLVAEGQANPSDIIFKEIDSMVAAGLADFYGTKTPDTWVGSFEVRPTPTTASETLIAVDAGEGICVIADLRGKEPPKAKFLRKDCTAKSGSTPTGTKPVAVSWNVDADDIATKVKAVYRDDSETKGERSFRYRIPSLTKFSIDAGELGQSSESRQMIGQLGMVASLPLMRGVKSGSYTLKFYEATGALKSFEFSSKTAFGKAVADQMGTSATTLLDAKLKASDPLTTLTRQRLILEERKKIKEYCDALKITNCPE